MHVPAGRASAGVEADVEITAVDDDFRNEFDVRRRGNRRPGPPLRAGL